MTNGKFINSREVPEHKIVKFLAKDNKSVIGTAIAIMDDEVSIKASSTYGDLSPFGGNNLMTLLASSTEKGIMSGQFALQGAQIWQKTDPLDMSFSIKFYMNDSAEEDVIQPVNNLMQLALPTLDNKKIGNKTISINAGFLIPPGPNIQTILNQTLNGNTTATDKLLEDYDNKGRGIITIKIGKFNFSNMVLKNVVPTFATVVDEDGYPVSASVSIDASTFNVCTTDYIDSVFKG